MKKRKLTKDESKQVSITKLFHENRLKKGLNWKYLMLLILLEILFSILIYRFDSSDIALIIMILIIGFMIWALLDTYKNDKKQSLKLLGIINGIGEEIIVKEYECKKAIYLKEYEDEGNCFALEIGKNELLFWWEGFDFEDHVLPNTKFEIFENEELELIFNRRINALGERFQPLVISPEIKWDNWDIIHSHREIISFSVDEFLDKLEAKYLC